MWCGVKYDSIVSLNSEMVSAFTKLFTVLSVGAHKKNAIQKRALVSLTTQAYTENRLLWWVFTMTIIEQI